MANLYFIFDCVCKGRFGNVVVRITLFIARLGKCRR